jgi:hypothetical protein
LTGANEWEIQGKLKAVIQTLFKILTNIQSSPFEQKFRKLPKKSERIQQQLLSSPSAIEFMRLAGFTFQDPDFIEFNGWSAEQESALGTAVQNIETLVASIGGVVEDPNKFDPFKSGVTSTTGFKQIGDSGVNKVTSTMNAIEKIKKDREATLETKVEDRALTVIKFTNSNVNVRQVNMFLAAREKAEEEKKQETEQISTSTVKPVSVDITEEDEIAAAVKLIAENEKNSIFRDKRSIELEKVQKQAHHTRTKIRVKFPDTYIL